MDNYYYFLWYRIKEDAAGMDFETLALPKSSRNWSRERVLKVLSVEKAEVPVL